MISKSTKGKLSLIGAITIYLVNKNFLKNIILFKYLTNNIVVRSKIYFFKY